METKAEMSHERLRNMLGLISTLQTRNKQVDLTADFEGELGTLYRLESVHMRDEYCSGNYRKEKVVLCFHKIIRRDWTIKHFNQEGIFSCRDLNRVPPIYSPR